MPKGIRKKRKQNAKKDEEVVLKKTEEEKAKASEEENVAKNLHNIMNGIDEDKADKDKQSPVKMQDSPSKTSTRRVSSKTHNAVSTQKNQPQTEAAPSILKTTKFIDTYIHPHRRIMLELAITLTKEDTFDEFANALASLLSNPQILTPSLSSTQSNPSAKIKTSRQNRTFPPT